MKFWLGFTLGAALASAIVTNMTIAQQEQLRARARSAVERGRTADVARSVREGVGSIADSVTDRVTGAVDSTAEQLSDAVASEDASSGAAAS